MQVIDDGYDLFLTLLLYPSFSWDDEAYHLENDPEHRTFAEILVDVVAADVIARFQRQAGRDVLFQTGTDEHGLKMAQAARARGIAEGDVVRIFNARGACLAGVRFDSRQRADVIVLSTGAWYDPLVPGETGTLDKHGNPNVLTLDKGTSKLAQAPAAHSLLVEVERYAGEVPEVTAHQPPVIIDREVLPAAE